MLVSDQPTVNSNATDSAGHRPATTAARASAFPIGAARRLTRGAYGHVQEGLHNKYRRSGAA
jgi:hypothetical protein